MLASTMSSPVAFGVTSHIIFTTRRNSFDLRKAEFPHLLAGVEEWTQDQLHQWPADIVNCQTLQSEKVYPKNNASQQFK